MAKMQGKGAPQREQCTQGWNKPRTLEKERQIVWPQQLGEEGRSDMRQEIQPCDRACRGGPGRNEEAEVACVFA